MAFVAGQKLRAGDLNRPFGHAGLISGFQAVSATNGAYITLSAQTLLNGMQFASNSLIVPRTGLYEIVAKAYFTGGSAYAGQWGATINSAALPIPSSAAGNGILWKADGNDYSAWSVVRRTLNAGDALRLWHSGAGSAWGTDGYNGSSLEVLFIAGGA